MMQAFIYRHLVPSRELLVRVTGGKRRGPALELADAGSLRVPEDGTAEIEVKTMRLPNGQEIRFELSDPPEGMILQDVSPIPGGLKVGVKFGGDALRAGVRDNLIVEAFTEVPRGKPQDGKTPQGKRRISLGVLPAIPFEIVQPDDPM
jgi:hypothetical protein